MNSRVYLLGETASAQKPRDIWSTVATHWPRADFIEDELKNILIFTKAQM
jgi:hypothetical protein